MAVPPGLKDCRLLAVDDDGTFRAWVREVLECEGVEVHETSDVPGALALLSGRRFDAVVSDVQMPGGGAAALYRGTCERDARLATRFVFLTGDPAGPDAQRTAALSGCRVLGKPVAVELLLDAVRETIGSSSPR